MALFILLSCFLLNSFNESDNSDEIHWTIFIKIVFIDIYCNLFTSIKGDHWLRNFWEKSQRALIFILIVSRDISELEIFNFNTVYINPTRKSGPRSPGIVARTELLPKIWYKSARSSRPDRRSKKTFGKEKGFLRNNKQSLFAQEVFKRIPSFTNPGLGGKSGELSPAVAW